MVCPTWGPAASEEEVGLLVGPAALLSVIMWAIAEGFRPNGMAIGTRGRRMPIVAAALLAMATVVLSIYAVYANEACIESFVISRNDFMEVTFLKLYWMLVPGVGTASIVSAMCTLVAAQMSLPRRRGESWRVDHIPRILRNGVISPQDRYGIGVGALKELSILWWTVYALWGVIVFLMIYTAARGDFTNGILNLAGIFAIATNTGIPVWNESKIGSGMDKKSENVDLVSSVETNVVGNFHNNVSMVTIVQESPEEKIVPPIVNGRTQGYVVANAHAMITDYRGEEMDVGWFKKHKGDPEALGRAIVDATFETTKRLSRAFEDAQSGDEKTEQMTLSAYMGTIATSEAWDGKWAQRRRLLALAVAIAWAMKITGRIGGKIARRDDPETFGHEIASCSCCMHRWTVWRPLSRSPDLEMSLLFGTSGHLPQVLANEKKREFADQVWAAMMEGVTTNIRNRGLLLYFWCMALMDNGMLQHYDTFDFFPQASVELQAFSPEDFKTGCSNMGVVAGAVASTGRLVSSSRKPGVTAPGATPIPAQRCEVDGKELRVENTMGRHRLFPHPKSVDHIARRMLYRGALAQLTVWGIQGSRGLFAG